ncbi:MAG: hypothetical protein H6707_14435 [Deltaproteobacteria bacterium]|nr:hypothetical protein [Deltaproteobacteria bacterium]
MSSDPPNEAREETPDAAEGEKGRLRQQLEGVIPEMIRRAVVAGVGAVFSSEEGLRKLAGEFSLPKDVASYLIGQAQGSKDEILRIIGKELRRFLENVNLNEELSRVLTTLSLEIKTEVRFIPNDQKAPRPSIRNRVRIKRADRDD